MGITGNMSSDYFIEHQTKVIRGMLAVSESFLQEMNGEAYCIRSIAETPMPIGLHTCSKLGDLVKRFSRAFLYRLKSTT